MCLDVYCCSFVWLVRLLYMCLNDERSTLLVWATTLAGLVKPLMPTL